MIHRYAPPSLLLIALAWATASNGGTGAPDLVLVSVLLLLAFLAARSSADRQPLPVVLLIAFLLTEAWLIAEAALQSDLNVATMRVPVLIAMALICARTATLLDLQQREIVLRGFITIGSMQAVIATVEFVSQIESANITIVPTRAEALIGNANAFGIFLVAAAALTARELTRHQNGVFASALALQAIAILLTQSRLAILVALCLLAWSLKRGTWRIAILVAPWMILAMLVVIFRFATTGFNRVSLLQAAISQITEHPAVGRGPTGIVFKVPAGQAPPTTHAHNEPLQLAVEYGLVGLALVVVVLILAFHGLNNEVQRDGWVMAAATSLAASGLTDYSLRITAITVSLAALTAVAVTPPRPDRSHSSARASSI